MCLDHITAQRRLRFSSRFVYNRRAVGFSGNQLIANEVINVLLWRPVAQLVRARP